VLPPVATVMLPAREKQAGLGRRERLETALGSDLSLTPTPFPSHMDATEDDARRSFAAAGARRGRGRQH